MTKADWNYAMKVRKEKGDTTPERYGYSIEMGISLCDRCKKRADCKDFLDGKKVLTVAFCTEYVDEVVLCKDCKYFCKEHKKTKWGACDHDAGLVVTFPDSYCSYGERKENE